MECIYIDGADAVVVVGVVFILDVEMLNKLTISNLY